MSLHPDAAYDALKAHDARFDGRFYVGVTSTGIYCRPVCRVRLPRRENCRFFDTAAQAEIQGFRPCLKCRPELAPGVSFTDSSRSLADTAARWIERAVQRGDAITLPALSARLGVTDRHLRRIFVATHGVAPRDYIGTQRLLLAKQLLTDTEQPVTQVALASGYDSVRRFNAAFAERYRLNPTQLRRARRGSARRPTDGETSDDAWPQAQATDATSWGDAGPVSVRLAYRPPYDIAALATFLARRQLARVEAVADADTLHPTWQRTLQLTHRGQTLAGWFAARYAPERCEVQLTVAPTLAPALGLLIARLRSALDLNADPALIDPVLARMPLPPRPGLRLPNGIDGFEIAVRVILGQQITVKAARTLAARLVDRYGEPLTTPWPGIDRLFPSPAALAQADPNELGALGIVGQRIRAIRALADAVVQGHIAFDGIAPLADTLAALRELPGIGEWSAQMIAMRALAWPDAFPATDIGLCNALGLRNPTAVTAQAEAWRPWRAYAVMRLWHHQETQE